MGDEEFGVGERGEGGCSRREVSKGRGGYDIGNKWDKYTFFFILKPLANWKSLANWRE